MQAIYQWQMTAQDLVEIERQFYTDENLHKADLSYFRELLHQVPAHLEELDMRLGKHLDRPVAEVDPVERAVLRNGCYELIYRRDIPYKVVINEAIRLTKKFGAEHGYRFINGVLDGVVKDLHKSSATSSPQR